MPTRTVSPLLTSSLPHLRVEVVLLPRHPPFQLALPALLELQSGGRSEGHVQDEIPPFLFVLLSVQTLRPPEGREAVLKGLRSQRAAHRIDRQQHPQ